MRRLARCNSSPLSSSAGGAHSVRDWKPSWVDTVSFKPVGLAFEAGYRP
jgi:hypothetical protein